MTTLNPYYKEAVNTLMLMATDEANGAQNDAGIYSVYTQLENAIHALITIALGDPRIDNDGMLELQKHRAFAASSMKKFR